MTSGSKGEKMKTKASKRDIMSRFKWVLKVKDGGLKELLKYETPEAYTCGKYGWNCDIYTCSEFPNVCISTGPRPFGNLELSGENIKHFRSIIHAFEISGINKEKYNELVIDFFEAIEVSAEEATGIKEKGNV